MPPSPTLDPAGCMHSLRCVLRGVLSATTCVRPGAGKGGSWNWFCTGGCACVSGGVAHTRHKTLGRCCVTHVRLCGNWVGIGMRVTPPADGRLWEAIFWYAVPGPWLATTIAEHLRTLYYARMLGHSCAHLLRRCDKCWSEVASLARLARFLAGGNLQPCLPLLARPFRQWGSGAGREVCVSRLQARADQHTGREPRHPVHSGEATHSLLLDRVSLCRGELASVFAGNSA